MIKVIALSSAVFTTSVLSASSALVNRYSFGDAGGAAGSVVTDSVSGANGVVVGDGGLFSGGSLSLPGGAGNSTAAYVDLPNGILSAHSQVTVEAWYTQQGLQGWSRVWDFGSSIGGEVPGSGGGGQGQDYFMWANNRGTNIGQQRMEIRNLDAGTLGGGTGPVDGDTEPVDANLASSLGTQYHVAVAWDGIANTVSVYRDGQSIGSRAVTFGPQDMNDVNNWLGRSNWTNDAYFQGDFDEFRVWNNVFDDSMAAASFAAGPDSVIPEPSAIGLAGISGLLLLRRRRR